MDLREVGYDDREWIDLAQDRDRWRAYVRAAMNLRVPKNQAHLGQKAWVDITARLEKPMYYDRNDHDFKIKCRKQKTDVGKVPEKPQPGNLSQPGIEPGPSGFAARRADRYFTGVDSMNELLFQGRTKKKIGKIDILTGSSSGE
ncbi:hypothetical protein ANN_09035 [Periplaneta americana]|uniref:Uncharacterized protein n=1 Tax=Periplaneta americana TaxID=6978 RepID=A0ABQ8TMB2_PERAM|nr:hypothetical protein ANN_09035 [Periplaneta americana]